MNKIISKEIFIKNKILTPEYFPLKKIVNTKYLKKIIKQKKMKLPLVVKPINEGSSIGVKIVKNLKSLKKSINNLLSNYDEIIVEQYIGGQEIQAAVIDRSAIGAIELIPKRSFYDYKAKYTKAAKTKHIMPARLKKKDYDKVLKLAKRAHRVLSCKGVSRADFKFFNNKFYLLEINTQPGMTNLSLVPEIANHCGISFPDLIEKILLDASINR